MSTNSNLNIDQTIFIKNTSVILVQGIRLEIWFKLEFLLTSIFDLHGPWRKYRKREIVKIYLLRAKVLSVDVWPKSY